MLNAVVFLCGAALMSLELVAARVLAPATGNSIFVGDAPKLTDAYAPTDSLIAVN